MQRKNYQGYNILFDNKNVPEVVVPLNEAFYLAVLEYVAGDEEWVEVPRILSLAELQIFGFRYLYLAAQTFLFFVFFCLRQISQFFLQLLQLLQAYLGFLSC